MYKSVDSGVKVSRSLVPSRDRWCGTIDFYRLYGCQTSWVLPGDIWKETCNSFIRLNPMLTPSLTPMKAKTRHFFVPLRQVEPDLTEYILTGSKDGKVVSETLPSFPSILSQCEVENNQIYVAKDSIAHVIFEVPFGYIHKDRLNDECLARLYWLKGYCKIWWDYYRDENLGVTIRTVRGEHSFRTDDPGNDGFNDFVTFVSKYCHILRCFPVLLPKDYFVSSLPWILKGSEPAISFTVEDGLTWNGNTQQMMQLNEDGNLYGIAANTNVRPFGKDGDGNLAVDAPILERKIQDILDNISLSGNGAFTASNIRDLFAETRVFERLARTGSRYIEYLRANFNIAPSDGTLQRPVNLGGFSQDILTTEVLQQSEGENPVGTMRGHGISNMTNSMNPYVAKEFGMLFTLFSVEPRIQYQRGIKRELTYSSRFDFFNPSFQRLSEQEVRIGEISFGTKQTDTKNDSTFGFQGMYNELRSGKERFFGSMLDDQAQWNQAINITYEMAENGINGALINGVNYSADFLRPFGLLGEDENTKPIIVDFYISKRPYRPMIKEATPGLVDHN